MSLLFDYDEKNKSAKYLIGTDEAGRGPLAGPVVAAAVCFENCSPVLVESLSILNDSKKLTHVKREKLYDILIENTINSIVTISVDEIEKINILQASLKAMRLACNEVTDKIGTEELEVFIDGNKKIPMFSFPQKSIVKGDAKSASIAAASILAKVYRDRLMCEYSLKYPEYGWADNKGYGTQQHVSAILKYGVTPIHRKSFLSKILCENVEKNVQLKLKL